MLLYKLVRPILYVVIKLYKPKYIGLENIPKDGAFILAGNHTSYLDPLLVASSTKRCVHFFAKDSLYKGIKKPIFKGLGIIPVNRSIKDKNSLENGIKCLKNNHVVGIFPEGTINRTNDIIMKFKYGTVKMSYETNTKIIPFAIKNKYKFLKKSVTIVFDTPIIAKNNLEKSNVYLENKVKNLLIKDV